MRSTDKSERGRRSSQAVGVLAVRRPHRRPFPFVSGQSFLFPMPVVFGFLVIPLPLSVRVFRLELITTNSTRLTNQEEKNVIKKTIYVNRCKTAGVLLHRDCWRDQDEPVRQRAESFIQKVKKKVRPLHASLT